MSLDLIVLWVVCAILLLWCGFRMGQNSISTTEDKLKAIAEHEKEIERLKKEVGK